MSVRAFSAVGVMVVGFMAIAGCGSDGAQTAGQSIEPDSVISGEVSRSGVPVAGLEVFFEGWPREDVLEQLADGDSVDLLDLGHVVTDDDGWFSFSVDPADVDPRYLGDDGWLDIAVMFGEDEALWHFTAIPNTSGDGEGIWESAHFTDAEFAARASDGKAPMHLFVDLDADPQVVEDGNDPADWAEE